MYQKGSRDIVSGPAVCDLIKPGVREKDIAIELEYRMGKFGAEADILCYNCGIGRKLSTTPCGAGIT